MLNLLPLRNPAYSLLFGKTGLQRIKIGKDAKVIEIDTSSINEMYSHVKDDVILHNHYSPMTHKKFMEYKLNAYHLIEAYENPERSYSTTLSNLPFFDKLSKLYCEKLSSTHVDTLNRVNKYTFSFPIRGKNI